MSANDQSLLQQWVHDRDAEAFRMLAMRHASMVYNTSRRILRDPSDAEDVAQECFEALVRAGDKPGAYLGAWLHRVATNLSFTHIEAKRRRQDREDRFAANATSTTGSYDEDLYAHVDKAIAALPDRLRYPLVAHFLENQTHDAIAESIGVSRQTITYRIGQAVGRVRSSLKRRGVVIAAAAFTEFLHATSSEAVPARLAANLGKLAVAGASAAPVGLSLAGVYGLVSIKAFLVAATIILLGGAGVYALRAEPNAPRPAMPSAPEKVAIAQPNRLTEPERHESPAPIALTAASVPVSHPAANIVRPTPAKQSQPRDRRAEIQRILESPVSFEFENIYLAELLEFVNDSYKLNLALDPRVVLPCPQPGVATPRVAHDYVTDGIVPYLNVQDVSLGDALRALCRPLGLDFALSNGIISISSPALLDAEGFTRLNASDDSSDPVLQTTMSLEFEDIHISEALQFVSDSWDVNITIDHRAVAPRGRTCPAAEAVAEPAAPLEPPFVTTGIVPHIDLKNVPLNEALATLLRPLNLAYSIEDGFVWISSPDRIEQEPFASLDTSHASPALIDAVQTPADYEFDEIALAEVLRAMAKNANVSIMIDTKNTNVPALTVSDYTLKDIPFGTALNVLVRQHDLACVAKGQDIIVTTPAHVRDANFILTQEPVAAQPSPKAPAGVTPPTAPSPPPKAPAATEPSAPIGTGNPEAVYAQAQKSYSSGNYDEAFRQFKAYQHRSPASENAPNALFWMAKSLQNLEQCESAAGEFERLRTTYPASVHVPYAMLYQATCQAKLGQTARAIELMQEVIQKYPTTPAADQAKTELKRLKSN